jgi:hypothetical protein
MHTFQHQTVAELAAVAEAITAPAEYKGAAAGEAAPRETDPALPIELLETSGTRRVNSRKAKISLNDAVKRLGLE